MAEKNKPAAETTEKVVTKYDKKVQRRKEEERKEQQRRKRNRIIGAVAAVALVAFIAYFPISRYIATHSAYINVAGYDVTEAEFDYYYNIGANNYISSWGAMASYMGLDTSKDYADQMYSQYMTWDDFFQQSAVDNLKRSKGLLKEGKEKGFVYDTSAETDAFIEALKEAAEAAGMTTGDYLKANFGKYATLKNIRPIIEESCYISAYYNEIIRSKKSADEEVTAYYEENRDTYDSVDYLLAQVEADIPEGESTTDDEGNVTTADPTQEQIAEAMEAAKAEADEKEKTIEADGELQENIRRTGANSLYREWLFEEGRKAGDTTVVEDSTNHRYYVLRFEKRYLDPTCTVNIRAISTDEDMSETILEEWNSTGANEEAFIALVEKYSNDDTTNLKGGLYEDLDATRLSEELGSWMLEEGRKAGDVTAINGTDGSHFIFYYIGQGEPAWRASVISQLASEYQDQLMENTSVTDSKGHLTYLKALAEEEAASKAAQDAAQDETQDEAQDGSDGNDAGGEPTESGSGEE